LLGVFKKKIPKPPKTFPSIQNNSTLLENTPSVASLFLKICEAANFQASIKKFLDAEIQILSVSKSIARSRGVFKGGGGQGC